MNAFPRVSVPLNRILLASLALAVGAVMSGCFAVAAGAGAGAAVAYAKGRLETNLASDYNKVCKATQQAITQLEFAKISDKKDGLKAEFLARTALDKKVQIDLTKAGDRLTKVVIHVGLFGDQEISQAILDKIKANL
ncbi:MAG: DUF3568 family protein [Opitutaceae bacterium]|nr:DUF3568 family protein [Opitutaceae bacterium]